MTSKLFLWDHPVSPFAQKVRIALREKQIPFDFQTPKGGGTGNTKLLDSVFVKQNHRLEIPTLQDGDAVIFESTIILEYIEDKFPGNPLRPESAAGRAKARMIEDVCDNQYEPINWGMGEISTFKRAEGRLADSLKRQAKLQTDQLHQWLTEQLGNDSWFGGDVFGLADVCVWPFVNRSTSYGLEPKEGTLLRSWYERANKRPSIKSVLEEFATGVASGSAAYGALQSGMMKRQYRDHRLEWLIKSGGIEIVQKGLEDGNVRFSWP
ncbi:hypothetical protein B0A52_00526 [Exophiala mesophila]|uniref:Glutathione S-transferase n=1 Tax=Exophiala mesophila TaxID=212818 RepID=A0A438NHI1_EXOME|nr:hypothetical protein B0A52_00526 [Exophiala mesophila]